MHRALVLVLLLGPLAGADDDRPDRRADPKLQQRINQAIEEGVAHLQRVQRKDGSWPYTGTGEDGTGGLTALALYALAASRVPPRDPSIRRGLAWTEKHRSPYRRGATYGTYSASLLVLALTRIDPEPHRARIGRLAERLVRSQRTSDMWSYGLVGKSSAQDGRDRPRGPSTGGDNSNSQFAVLALWAAYALAGIDVPDRTWQRIHGLYRRTQNSGGGWPYRATGGGSRGRPTMTAAGLVSYVYATAALRGGVRALPDARRTPVAQAGLAALFRRPRFNYENYYLVYSLERVGTVMALPEKDWYFEGARALVAAQQKDGSWQGGVRRGDARHVYETSLALLFLSRATRYFVGPTTRRAAGFPDPARPGNLVKAFDHYHVYKPAQRSAVVDRFGRAGAPAVGLFIARLRHQQAPVRETAYELLERLVEKRFFFEPRWPAPDRALMLQPIDTFWRLQGERLRWDAERRLFVVAR
ncbi:MAG: hypothetical protein ACYTEZ_00555 [Planctomycetota bacterium]|jgi:hypothetical protein